ncbi:NDR1/HIN1-like protein 13 [Ipomoea triloba]|uniref:NDR1/HIN1-like protein 13 n=1 Tax=Ipomoea triloba TaxID=35885 RepID=UPI00125E440D|nr:NDR1/HIN1-like protein 13 [Ipomoea triloba]
MEGRVGSPAGGDGRKGDPPLTSLTFSLPVQPGKDPETYVIQIPRDQVYRVPPPENAKIVESYQGMQSNKKDTRLRKCCFWFLVPLAVLGILIGIIVGTINGLYTPKSPKFSMATIQFKKSPRHPNFHVSLLVHNTNQRMKVSFGDGGKSSLVFKNREIGKGKYPTVSVKPKETTAVDLKMAAKLSGDLHKELNGRRKKSMALKISVPMEISSWAKGKKKDVSIKCVFKVGSLAKSADLSEECETDF